jgi:hypothetical protein
LKESGKFLRSQPVETGASIEHGHLVTGDTIQREPQRLVPWLLRFHPWLPVDGTMHPPAPRENTPARCCDSVPTASNPRQNACTLLRQDIKCV